MAGPIRFRVPLAVKRLSRQDSGSRARDSVCLSWTAL